jgi:hypothetical protein
MKKSLTACFVMIVALAAMPALAANTLGVNTAAAHDGTYGMYTTQDGSTNRVYVQDNSPTDEKTYNASFEFSLNTIDMTCPGRQTIFLARSDVPESTIRIVLARFYDCRWAVRLGVRKDNGDFTFVGGDILPNTSFHKIGLEWAAASAPGANDGWARLLRNDNVKKEKFNIDNDTTEVDYARLGLTSGLDATSTGTLYYDSFVSTR